MIRLCIIPEALRPSFSLIVLQLQNSSLKFYPPQRRSYLIMSISAVSSFPSLSVPKWQNTIGILLDSSVLLDLLRFLTKSSIYDFKDDWSAVSLSSSPCEDPSKPESEKILPSFIYVSVLLSLSSSSSSSSSSGRISEDISWLPPVSSKSYNSS